MASITKNRSIHRTSQQEYTSIKDEKYHLEVDIRKKEKERSQAEEELIKLRQEEQDLISTSGTSVEKMKEFDDGIEKLHNQERDLTREIGVRERKSDSLNRDLSDVIEKESKIKAMLSTFGFDETISDLNNTKKDEALSALEVLGFSKKQSDRVVVNILKNIPDASVELIIKEALKNL